MKKFLAITMMWLLFGACAACAARGDDGAEKVSETFKYSGYSKKEYAGYEKTSQYVEMSDGVKIAVDVYLPAKGPERKSFPAVLEYTPYSRAFVSAAFKPLEKTHGTNLMGGKGAEIPNPFCFNKMLLERGYAVMLADVRGSGASYGSRLDLMPRLGNDGAELVEWTAKQPWSDGNIGMKGGSYMAITSILTAGQRPPHLKAIFLMVYPFGYQDMYVHGVYNQGFMKMYSELLWAMNMNMTKSAGSMMTMPSAPVTDEDGDGELLDEIPIDKNKDGSFLDDYKYPDDPKDPPQYEDGKPRNHVYYLATREHLGNAFLGEWMPNVEFIDSDTASVGLGSKFGNFNGYNISPISNLPEIMKSGIPIYHVTGWMDAQTRSAMIFFDTARKTNPSKLLVIPGYHILSGPFYKYLGENQDAVLKGISTENVRFFDRYLKGVQNGIDTEPPVRLFVMGKGWRSENEWPPARAKDTAYYLRDDNTLVKYPCMQCEDVCASPGCVCVSPGAVPISNHCVYSPKNPGPFGADKYTADLSTGSNFGLNNGNRWLMFQIPAEAPDRAELDKKCLTYTTEALAADVEVTGHPIMDVWVSSTADSGDIFAYLEDVTEDGKAILVTENPMRAGFAGLKDNNKMISRGTSGVDVFPKLPWHGYEKADFDPAPFAGGKIVWLHFDLQPTSWVFKKGHKIRVSFAAADWPTFRLDPKLSPENKPDGAGNVVPVMTFYRDAQYQSRIILPVVGE